MFFLFCFLGDLLVAVGGVRLAGGVGPLFLFFIFFLGDLLGFGVLFRVVILVLSTTGVVLVSTTEDKPPSLSSLSHMVITSWGTGDDFVFLVVDTSSCCCLQRPVSWGGY